MGRKKFLGRYFYWFLGLVVVLGPLLIGMHVYVLKRSGVRVQSLWFHAFGQKMKFKEFNINYPDELVFSGLLFQDTEQDTILWVKDFSVDVGISQLLLHSELTLDELKLSGGTFDLDQLTALASDSAFIKMMSPDSAEANPFLSRLLEQLAVTKLNFENISLRGSQDILRMGQGETQESTNNPQSQVWIKQLGIEGLKVGKEQVSARVTRVSLHDIQRGLQLTKGQANLVFRPKERILLLENLALETAVGSKIVLSEASIAFSLPAKHAGMATQRAAFGHATTHQGLNITLDKADLYAEDIIPYLHQLAKGSASAEKLINQLTAYTKTLKHAATNTPLSFSLDLSSKNKYIKGIVKRLSWGDIMAFSAQFSHTYHGDLFSSRLQVSGARLSVPELLKPLFSGIAGTDTLFALLGKPEVLEGKVQLQWTPHRLGCVADFAFNHTQGRFVYDTENLAGQAPTYSLQMEADKLRLPSSLSLHPNALGAGITLDSLFVTAHGRQDKADTLSLRVATLGNDRWTVEEFRLQAHQDKSKGSIEIHTHSLGHSLAHKAQLSLFPAGELKAAIEFKHLDVQAFLGPLGNGRPLALAGVLETEIKNWKARPLLGTVSLSDLKLRGGKEEIDLPRSLQVSFDEEGGIYTFLMEGEAFEFQVNSLSPSWSLADNIAHYLSPSFSPLSLFRSTPKDLRIELEVDWRVKPVSEFLGYLGYSFPSFSNDARLKLDVWATGGLQHIKALLVADTLRYATHALYGLNWEFVDNYLNDSVFSVPDWFLREDVTHMHMTAAGYQGEQLSIENPQLRLDWQTRDNINFILNLEGESSPYYTKLTGLSIKDTLREGESRVWDFHMDEKDQFFLGKPFVLNKEPRVRLLSRKGFDILRFDAQTTLGHTIVDGQLLRDKGHLNVEWTGIDLDTLNPKGSEASFRGMGRIRSRLAYEKDKPLEVSAEVFIDDFELGGVLLGDAAISLAKDKTEADVIHISAQLNDIYGGNLELKNRVKWSDRTITGYLHFQQSSIVLLAPILSPSFTLLKGTLDGKVSIRGGLDSPRLDGIVALEKGGMRFNEMGMEMLMDGEVLFEDHDIIFNRLVVRDPFEGKLQLFGAMRHNGGWMPEIDFKLLTESMQIVNLSEHEGKTYYGTIQATGSVEMKGRADAPRIEGDLKIESGTRVFFPYYKVSPEEENIDFVSFVDDAAPSIRLAENNPKDREVKTFRVENNKEADVPSSAEGEKKEVYTELRISLEVLPGAYAEVITQLVPEEYLRFYSTGNVLLLRDPAGNFNMRGGLEINRGTYRYSHRNYGFLSKEFVVDKGSTLNWDGPATDLALDLKMRYSQRVSSAPLRAFGETWLGNDASSTSSNQRIQADVCVAVKGPLDAPASTFSLELPGLGVGSSFLQQIQSDEQLEKQQIISLIFLGRFAVPEGIDLVGDQFNAEVMTSLGSDYINSRVHALLSDVEEGLSMGVDMVNQRYRVSYMLMDGRLRFQRDASLQAMISPQGGQRTASTLVGDWEVEYLLFPSGNLRLRGYFNAIEEAQHRSLVGQYFATGLSLDFVTQFKSLRALRSRKKKRAKKKRP